MNSSRRPLRFRSFLVAALIAVAACGSPAVDRLRGELVACEEARESGANELAECNEQTTENLRLIARHLESVLVGSPEVEPPVAADPNLVEVDELQLSVPEPEPPTLERIEELSAAAVDLFLELHRRQENLERELAAARREARRAHETTQTDLARLQEVASGIDDRLGEGNELRSELARLEADRIRLRLAASGIADSVRIFDSERVHCRGCGWGFTDRFKRDLLAFHTELLQRLDEFPTMSEPDPN